jgi:hypothetical protein
VSNYVDIFTAGALGYNSDQSPMDLSPEFFTTVRNMRFTEGRIEAMQGDTGVLGTPTVDPYFAIFVEAAVANLWLYMGLTHGYAITGGVHTKVTRQTAMVDVPYTGAATNRWNACGWGDVVYLTNGVDLPQMWLPPDTTVKLANLTAFPSGDRCNIIRNFGPYIFALGYTTGGVLYPRRLRWSHPADPHAVPVSWDITDDTKDAGQTDIGSPEHGPLTDMLMIDKIALLYQRSAVYQVRLIGGQFIFDFATPVSLQVGAIAQDCVKMFNRGRLHFCAGAEDLVVISSTEIQSVSEKKIRKFLANAVSTTDFWRAFVVHNYREREMWYCFPEQGAEVCTLAVVYNYNDGTCAIRDLPSVRYGTTGIITANATDDTWDAGLDDSWDTGMDIPWDYSFDEKLRRNVLFVKANKLLQAELGTTFDGAAMTFVAERTDIAFVGRGRDGNWKAEPRVNKLVSEVWIKAEGASFNVRVGTQKILNGPVTWSVPKTFNPATMQKLDFTISGRLVAIRFEKTGYEQFLINGWTVRLAVLGRYK